MRLTIICALLISSLFIGCSEVRVTCPVPQSETDSLKQEIEALRFIVGQQRRMIECLRSGRDDCYGGV